MKKILKKIYKRIISEYCSNESKSLKCKLPNRSVNSYISLKSDFEFAARYKFNYVEIGSSKKKHKWVGAQILNDDVFFIPNDETRILKINNSLEYLDAVQEGFFKWSGSCLWNDSVYCFPRSANSFLKIRNDIVEEIPLSIVYKKEHHYSGVCTKEGIVYQPPRNTNHILKTDLKTGISKQIDIVNQKFKIDFRYCGSIIHPNGYIYFFPEYGRVIKLNPKSDEWCFIGKRVSTMCFDAKIGLDGNIYGYSAYQNGIMKINVIQDMVKMIHTEFAPGAYGTKYGLDGCLYSIPGDGTKVWKYDIDSDTLEEIYDLKDSSKAKYAGGITLRDGRIICVPATADSILVMQPNKSGKIPSDLYEIYCKDNY